jgi:hypothetical protein
MIKMHNLAIKEVSQPFSNILPIISQLKKPLKLFLKSVKLSIKPFVQYSPI